jgi:hypothetical protein
MTYQAASGAGARNMRELLAQMGAPARSVAELLADPQQLHPRHRPAVTERPCVPAIFRTELFTAPLAGSLIPWIDKQLENGQSREEWKGYVETNKILGREHEPDPIDGTCVRIGSMRCHSQGLTIKLQARPARLDEIAEMLADANDWVRVIPNEREQTIAELSPAAVTGTLACAGRAPAQDEHGAGVPLRLHGRRPVAVGGRGAAAAHACSTRRRAGARRSLGWWCRAPRRRCAARPRRPSPRRRSAAGHRARTGLGARRNPPRPRCRGLPPHPCRRTRAEPASHSTTVRCPGAPR